MEFEQFTEDALQALTFAQEEALRFHHQYIGTEHLLLGLMRDAGMSRVLSRHGADFDAAWRKVIELQGSSPKLPPPPLPEGRTGFWSWLWGRRAMRKENGDSSHERG